MVETGCDLPAPVETSRKEPAGIDRSRQASAIPAQGTGALGMRPRPCTWVVLLVVIAIIATGVATQTRGGQR
jgi:hypothetical protein